MIRDWELWPWMVAEGADDSGLALSFRRFEVGMRRTMTVIGTAIVPALRTLGIRFDQANEAAEALMRVCQNLRSTDR